MSVEINWDENFRNSFEKQVLQPFLKSQGLDDNDPRTRNIRNASDLIISAFENALKNPNWEVRSQDDEILLGPNGIEDIIEYDDAKDYYEDMPKKKPGKKKPVNKPKKDKNNDDDKYFDPDRYVWDSHGNLYSREEWEERNKPKMSWDDYEDYNDKGYGNRLCDY